MESPLKIQMTTSEDSKNNELCISIIDQPESFRRTKTGLKTFKASSGFEILSYEHPSISKYGLWVRGSKQELDHKWAEIKFNSVEEKLNYIARLKRAISEFNENYKK